MTLTSDNPNITMDPDLDFSGAMEWLHQHTNFPTFEEFKKNPDKYRQNPDEIFECIDNHNTFFKERVASIVYYWRGKYECRTLSKLFDISRNEGFNGSQLEMEPIAEPMDGSSNQHDTRIKITVNVWPKSEFRMRGGIVSND